MKQTQVAIQIQLNINKKHITYNLQFLSASETSSKNILLQRERKRHNFSQFILLFSIFIIFFIKLFFRIQFNSS